jgi:hypothetical protein
MTAFEAKRVSDAANHKNSEDIASDILNAIESAAKEGLYSKSFSYSLPLTFDYEKVVHRLKHEGYQVSVNLLPSSFIVKVMWN